MKKEKLFNLLQNKWDQFTELILIATETLKLFAKLPDSIKVDFFIFLVILPLCMEKKNVSPSKNLGQAGIRTYVIWIFGYLDMGNGYPATIALMV